jgi:hypothetical protein
MPSVERAELVNVLIDSLDTLPVQKGSALMDEALRRDQAVEEGRAHYLDETEFLRGIHRK